MIGFGILVVVGGLLAGCAGPGGGGRLELAADPSLRENIEWCDIWVTDANKEDLPRVLLIGDSITRGYFKDVETHLQGKAHCARLTTSLCVCSPAFAEEVELMLEQYRFAAIHINNGLHGWSYTEDQYGKALGPFMEFLMRKSQGASVIWAQTTPVVADGTTNSERTTRVKARNALASSIAARHQLPVDDLFGLVVDHPEYYSKDGVHFNQTGVAAQARQVAECVSKALDGRAGRP
jgi:hypothetical protein